MRILRITTLSLLLLAFLGCSGNQPNSSGTKEIIISSLLKEYGLGANITSILLVISGEGFDTITRELEIVDGEATVIVDVPLGEDRVFEMTAFAEDDIALYRGSTVSDVLAGVTSEVNIKLEPLVPMVRVSPMFTQTDDNTQKTVRVLVHNVDSLFGVSFRLEYDTNLVEVTAVSEGNLFTGQNPIFFTVQRPGYVAVAYSLRGNQEPQGVSADGSAAVITFAPRAVGTSFLRVPESTLSLIDWQGAALPRTGVLYIEEGEIQIDAP